MSHVQSQPPTANSWDLVETVTIRGTLVTQRHDKDKLMDLTICIYLVCTVLGCEL